ncbi:MAG TPA: DNA primase [Haloplasmataceae bacterium]
MALIPKHVIEQIIKGNDIVDVVASYVNLEKKGKNYFGLCPFHNEKTPSFSVSPEKQIFHCFSCGEGGDVAQFIAKIDNISYLDSLKKLAQRINLNINEYFADNRNVEFSKSWALNRFVADFYRFTLLNTKEGIKALDYLAQRQITPDLIEYFNIGLAPNSSDSLYQALKANNFSELLMLELGVVMKSENRYYDKFQNRIMFPITDDLGNIVGFSGRSYLESSKNEAKYINTQETPIFKKGAILYNLFNAKKAIRQNHQVYLFEGFMDVIASYKCGLQESIATMGTALTEEHVKLLKKYTNHVIICFDGDNPGIEATKKAIELINNQSLRVSVVTLPDGLDPDEYIKKYGKEKYLSYINQNQKSYREYMYELEYKNINFKQIASIDQFKKKVFQLLITATPTERELFLNRLSQDINVSFNTLQFDYKQYTNYLKNTDEPSQYDLVNQENVFRSIEKKRPSSKKLLYTQKLLCFFCLNNRKYISIINNDKRITFKDNMYRRFYYDLCRFYESYNSFDFAIFQEKFIKDDITYFQFVDSFYKDFKNYKGSFQEKHLKECLAVIINDLIASVVLQLKAKLHLTNDEQKKDEISQEIINQLKIIKVINNEVVE